MTTEDLHNALCETIRVYLESHLLDDTVDAADDLLRVLAGITIAAIIAHGGVDVERYLSAMHKTILSLEVPGDKINVH